MQTVNNDVTPAMPRGRLAPSPTGALHLGNARSFLLAWLSIRAQGGSVLLRMEDLDHPKNKPGADQQALDDLRWLGLDWDEGPDRGGPFAPYVQSQRIHDYAAALETLREAGLVYPCICSRQDVEAAQRAPHADETCAPYPGTCRGRFRDYDEAMAALPPGRLPAWRFRTPDQSVTIHDCFAGTITANVARRDGDFVIARHRDGAGYMLAVVVDDVAMRVSHVLRGDDLLPATHRQWLLYRALNRDCPEFAHVPLVVGNDGRRLAKRHGDTRLSFYRERGVTSSSVIRLLGSWCGIADAHKASTANDLLNHFDLDKVPRHPIVLDETVYNETAWLSLDSQKS